MFPELNINNLVQEETVSKVNQGKTFLYDFVKGDFVIKDGKLIEIEGTEAIKIWIEKILRTEKFKFEIYDGTDYGTSIKQLVQGRKVPQFFLQSEVKREIEEALKKNVEIDRVEDFRTEQNITTLTICFRVVLKNGDSFDREVNF